MHAIGLRQGEGGDAWRASTNVTALSRVEDGCDEDAEDVVEVGGEEVIGWIQCHRKQGPESGHF